MSALYDLTILLDPNAPEERRAEIMAGVRSMIEVDGTLVGEHDWGTRRLAYEIDKRPEAEYKIFQLEADPDLLDRLRHMLKITDGVLRSRTIRLKPGSPPPPPSPDSAFGRGGREDEATDTHVAPRAAADA